MPTEPPRRWLHSDRTLARLVARPVQRFLEVETASAAVLLVATLVALAWANSGWHHGYERLWATEVTLRIGSWHVTEPLELWINDGLMTIFFFVVGLEIKRELVVGELRDRRAALLPALAALGGMVAPALLYLALTASLGGEATRGWGIPMATDIAFALGALALLGSRVPGPLKVFLLTLAVVDDIGAIVVIAVAYSRGLSPVWLLAAAALVGLVVLLQVSHVRAVGIYVIVGTALWWCTFQSGIHATIAGVVLGLLTPARPFRERTAAEALAGKVPDDAPPSPAEVSAVTRSLQDSMSVAERLEDVLLPWTSFVIVPLFALANAGIRLYGGKATSTVAIAVAVALVAGKVIGIAGTAAVTVKARLAPMPAGVRARHLVGIGLLAGMGFTVALFMSQLAFTSVALANQAKLGILMGTVAAAVLGLAVLRFLAPAADPELEPGA